jgi:dTDP-4-dehydrorhamnose reductase
MVNVWIFGANGMLGSRTALELAERHVKFSPITRASLGKHRLGNSQSMDFETFKMLEESYGTPTHVVNALGVVKPRIDEANTESVLSAIQGNSIFPRNLGSYCEINTVHLIQIATDCVYSGTKGNYSELDLHDPTDVYGKTKSLGEFSSECISLIRCSIIGQENENRYSLVEWIKSQEPRAEIKGFTNHNWNGVTTKVFGMIAAGLILNKVDPVGKVHLVPRDKVSKYELVKMIKEELSRNDIAVSEFQAQMIIDRTLSTDLHNLNRHIWELGGFDKAPAISEMIKLGL